MVNAGSDHVRARRAIEALRSGVPNRDAVLELGSAHADIVDRFRQQLAGARTHEANGAAPSSSGFLIAGNFGTGKSHLLEYLQQLALQEHFVVSKVVISKETPLYDPVKLFRSAIQAASVPDRVGAALPQIASELKFESDAYVDFHRWVHDTRDVSQRFAATVYMHQHAQVNPDLIHRIISFWSGDPLLTGELRRELRQIGQASSYVIDSVSQANLAYQRFTFAARLMLAAGYNGWVLLFDEVDLVARYSFSQRAKAYAQMARWTGNLSGDTYPGISSVMAITSAYESEILEGKNDREAIPGKLRASPRETDQLLANQAERGLRLIDNARLMTLSQPTPDVIDDTYQKVKAIHGRAYSWTPPDVSTSTERTSSTRMREYVRSWINEWDLRRLFPEHTPHIEIEEMPTQTGEDPDLQSSDEDESTPTDTHEGG